MGYSFSGDSKVVPTQNTHQRKWALKITDAEIEARKSPKGGWTKKQFAEWGIEWPPPKGWREALIRGDEMEAPKLIPSPIRPEIPAHELLHQVVMAVINGGQGHLLWEYPDVLAYFGAQMPENEN